jgi:hypothetical protein
MARIRLLVDSIGGWDSGSATAIEDDGGTSYATTLIGLCAALAGGWIGWRRNHAGG